MPRFKSLVPQINQEQTPITWVLLKQLFYTSFYSCSNQEHQETTVYSIHYTCHTFSGSCTKKHL